MQGRTGKYIITYVNGVPTACSCPARVECKHLKEKKMEAENNTTKILIDTREQKPLEFYDSEVVNTEVVCLPYGDYHIRFKDGYEPPVVFERKSLSDLFGTLGKGYVRFKKEITKAKNDDVQLVIIIECSLTKIFRGIKHSKRSGGSVVKQLFTLMVRHKIPFVCCSNRKEMAQYIVNFYLSYNINRQIN